MKEFVEIARNFRNAYKSQNARLLSVAERQYKKIIHTRHFNSKIPPYLKLQILYRYAEVKLFQKRYIDAERYLHEAMRYNIHLDKSFIDYPGYEFYLKTPDPIPPKISGPYRVLGDMYLALHDLKKAKEAYKKSLDIDNENYKATRGFRLASLLLAPENQMHISGVVFKNILVKNSPWSISWQSVNDKQSGILKMEFFINSYKEKVFGKLFDNSTGVSDGNIENPMIQNNYLNFKFSVSQNNYDFCLSKNKTLLGIISSHTKNSSFIADAVATSAEI